MASRRTRIKGIANIPQRRKNVSEEKINENGNLTNEQDKDEGNPLINDIVIKSDDQPSSVNKSDDLPTSVPSQSDKELDGNVSEDLVIFEDAKSVTISSKREQIQGVSVEKTEENHISTPKAETSIAPLPSLPIRRRTFIKPPISTSVINRKPRQKVEKVHAEISVLEAPTAANKIETADAAGLLESDVKEKQPPPKGVSIITSEVTLDEVHLTSQIGVPGQQVESSDRGVRKIVPNVSNAPNSDTEYPPPPPSPSKINRSRIKAIPRLGYRKTSVSASESEDESKRNYNRNRNDSVCSTASGVPESISDCLSPQRPKDFNCVVQKKFNRTDQSRKLTEARRDFHRRFGATKPDRQRLTMMDLIFYNPTSNPMTVDSKTKSEMAEVDVEATDTNQLEEESEKIDDPPPEENVGEAEKSDEENEVPAPQIKIGPTGEIILDEKSLVIESKEVQKQREELQKTKLVDGDFDTGYGIYKKHKRAREWTKGETLRFYKALNTIGTDFTLMCELFPRRTRRELKQKFKKEEKINRSLIDKAVMQSRNFDYAELKHEVDMEERELEELRKQKEEEVKLRQEKMEERQLKKRKAMEKTEEGKLSAKQPVAQPKPKMRKVRKPRERRLNIDTVLEDSDADVSDIATQSESDGEEEIVAPLRPTRSGRIPRVTKKFDTAEECTVEHIMKKSRADKVGTGNIEPGSIMIITEAGPNGEPVHKIFMVTADNNATPLKLNSEEISKAIRFKKGMTAQNILTISASGTDEEAEEEPGEVNMTIPADENVTTLRRNSVTLNGCAERMDDDDGGLVAVNSKDEKELE